MLTIQIKNWYNEVVAVINDIFSLQVDDEVNKGGKLKLKFPTEKRLQEKPLQKGYRISITYGLKIGKVIRLFEGYITDVIVKTTQVEIQADNWLSYLQYRMVRSDRTYTDQTISSVVSAVFNELNTTSELPIQLGINDCESKITKDFKVGTSFYDILKYCWEAEKDLIVRVHNGYLEVSKNTGNILEGVWEYDARNTVGTNITDRSRKDSMDEFYTYIQNEGGNINDEEFEQQMKLIFEKYDSEGALQLPSWIAIPSINISRDIDWWDFNPWDRKNIRLITGYDWLPLQYLGLIQNRKVSITANGGIKAEIKISEEYKADTNILDLVLTNLRGKKAGGDGGDMTNYYTKSETTAIINNAVSGKADAVHTHLANQITDFASAVWTLITSALVSYYTKTETDSLLSGKSNTGHTHIFSDISGLETALEGKSDVGHSHEISDVSGLQSALNGKANSSHTHQTSDITGLDTALWNKADKNTTYTKDETDTLLSWKANSTHTHAISNITGLQSALNNKADLTDIPTVNNSTITIQINWTTLKSITLNQATGETINIPVPTKVSDLTNDSGFITKAVSDLTNYYTKSETYTKTEVDGMISNFGGFEVVATLPTTNIKTNVIYLKGPIGTGADRYEEYIYYSNTWTLIGETSVDLTNYIDKNTAFITINGVAYKFGDSLTTPNTEYDTMTQQEATAGTGTTARVITPKVLVDTISNMISWKADKSQIKAFVITESMVSVSTDATKGVSPYNTSYGYTNITVNDNAGVEWVEGALYIFVINTSMVVASAYRNVRIKIGSNWTYIPIMNAWNSILAGSSYFTKGRTDLYVYKTTNQSGWALHMNNDTSYSAMSVAEGKTGTATSGRVMRADYLKQIIEYYLQNIATPTANTHATNKKYVDDINTAIQQALGNKANSTHSHVWSDITDLASILSNYLPLTWGTLTGNLTGQQGTFTWLKATASNHMTGTPSKICVQDSNGTIYHRTPAEIKEDIGLGNASNVATGQGVLTLLYGENDEELGTFGANQSSNKTIKIPSWSSITELTENFVRTMIFAGVGDYDNVFRASSGLYRILNALDDHDNLGLEKGEVWEDIVSDTTDMSAITHSYSVMVAVGSSKVAMDEVLSSSTATKEISECWNSISIIAESELASDLYLSSENGIINLFTYQTAQDAFFGDPAKKQEIISEHIMTIVNSNTLLTSLYTDTVVANCIADSQEALNTIAGNGTKLGIVDDSATIMSAIATNSSALGNMSDSNFTTYILENSSYLTTTTSSTAGQNRINSMDADDLLPAIFYWTGLSGYNTFEALAESDSAMEVVQSSEEAMSIIECNEEASWYLVWRPLSTTVAYIPMEDDIAEKTWRSSFTNYSVTNTTINGIKCWYFNGGARLLTNVSAYTDTNHTICFWFKRNWWNDSWIVGSNPCWVLKWDWFWLWSNKYTYECYTGSNSWNIQSWTYNVSERHCVVFTWWKVYVDWVLQGTNSWNYNWGTVYTVGWHTTWNSCTNRFITWYMGDVVLDSSTWTEAQVLDYYNKTKKRYWFT